jgi:knotted carbamoyltransferase YgeW
MASITQNSIEDLLEKLSGTNAQHSSPDFLRTWDKSQEEIEAHLYVTQLLREMYYQDISPKVYDSGIAISIFKDNSTRTRYSYASGTDLLGLLNQELDMGKSQIAHGETILETANMISFLTRSIGIRDDKYLGVGHKYMKEYSKSLDIGYEEGVLANRPSVVNLQCDQDHPTQSLSDLSHLMSYYGGLENLKGKKITMSWAYSPSYGKPMSVAQGVIGLMSRFGMDITLAYPEEYHLIPEIEKKAAEKAKESGGSFEITHDMAEAVEGADIVYPKSWAPYGIMERRTELLEAGDDEGLKELEKEGLALNAKYKDWEYTEEMMETTKDGEALYMHCLPADITGVNCENGEVTESVFNQFRQETYIEASYKPFVIAAMIMLGQYGKETYPLLRKLIEKDRKIS